MSSPLDQYELFESLGVNQYGEVFAGHDYNAARDVAILRVHESLVLPPGRGEAFWQAVRRAAAVRDRNIVPVYDMASAERLIVMEMMRGNLGGDNLTKAVSPSLVRSVLRQVLEGLRSYHNAGLVHGDVKPSQFLYNEQGRVSLGFSPGLMVGDKAVHQSKDHRYHAPELLKGSVFGEVGPATDIYLAGFAALEMLAGPRFAGFFLGAGHDQQMAFLRWHGDPDRRLPNVALLLPECPPDLAKVLDRTLQKRVVDRYRDVDALLADLDNLPLELVPVQVGKSRSERAPTSAAIESDLANRTLDLTPIRPPTGNRSASDLYGKEPARPPQPKPSRSGIGIGPTGAQAVKPAASSWSLVRKRGDETELTPLGWLVAAACMFLPVIGYTLYASGLFKQDASRSVAKENKTSSQPTERLDPEKTNNTATAVSATLSVESDEPVISPIATSKPAADSVTDAKPTGKLPPLRLIVHSDSPQWPSGFTARVTARRTTSQAVDIFSPAAGDSDTGESIEGELPLPPSAATAVHVEVPWPDGFAEQTNLENATFAFHFTAPDYRVVTLTRSLHQLKDQTLVVHLEPLPHLLAGKATGRKDTETKPKTDTVSEKERDDALENGPTDLLVRVYPTEMKDIAVNGISYPLEGGMARVPLAALGDAPTVTVSLPRSDGETTASRAREALPIVGRDLVFDISVPLSDRQRARWLWLFGRGHVQSEPSYGYGRRLLAEAIELDPELAFAYRDRGLAAFDNLDLDSAAADAVHAVKLAPKDYLTLLLAAKVSLMKDDPKASIEHLEEAIRLRPKATGARVMRAQIAFNIGEYGVAESDLGIIVDQASDPALLAYASNMLGSIRAEQGQYEDSLKLINEAIRLAEAEEADATPYQLNKAKLFFERGKDVREHDLTAGTQILAQAGQILREVEPQDESATVEVLAMLGDVDAYLGDYESSLNWYSVIINKFPNRVPADIFRHRAIVLEKLGRQDEADVDRQTAEKMDAESQAAGEESS